MSLGPQIATLAKRSILITIRQPAILASVLFPLLFMAVTSAGAADAADLPCFPAKSYLDFYIAGALVQGTLFAGIGSGSQLATDIEMGFIRRLLLTPMQLPAVLVGLAAGAVFIGMIDAVALLIAGFVGGVRLTAGIPGLFVVVVLAMLVALAFSSIGALVAARTGSSDATQSVFPLFFILMIFSSYFMPRDCLAVGWFKTIATYNPATYIIEALRSPVIHPGGWDGRALVLGLAAIVGIAALGFGSAARTLRRTLERT